MVENLRAGGFAVSSASASEPSATLVTQITAFYEDGTTIAENKGALSAALTSTDFGSNLRSTGLGAQVGTISPSVVVLPPPTPPTPPPSPPSPSPPVPPVAFPDGCAARPCPAGQACFDANPFQAARGQLFSCGAVAPPAAGASCGGGFAPAASGGCALCMLAVSVPSTSLPAGAAVSASTAVALLGTATAVPPATASPGAACSLQGGISYMWRGRVGLNDFAFASPLAPRSPTLDIAPGLLRPGSQALFILSACFAANPAACGSSAVSFSVVSSPLVASLAGVGVSVGETPVTLDASGSVDPDAQQGVRSALGFTWACAASDGGACLASSGQPLRLVQGVAQQTVTLAGSASGKAYNFSVTVASGSRTASASGIVTVSLGPRPGILPLGGATQIANPTDSVRLSASVTSIAPSSLTTVWSQLAGPALGDLGSPAVSAAGNTGPSLVLLPGVLQGGQAYSFGLTAADSTGTSAASFAVAVSVPPSGGSVSVSPSAGTAMNTTFTVAAEGWVGAAAPLLYQLAYVPPDTPGAPPVVLSPFSPAAVTRVQLPGAVRPVVLLLSVQDSRGAIATNAASASVAVSWPVLATPTDAAAFATGATSAATSALETGDVSGAVNAARGAAALFNAAAAGTADPATNAAASDPAAVAVRSQARLDLLNLMTAALAVGRSTPDALVSAASAVSALTQNPAELPASAQQAAIDALGPVVSAGAALTPAAAREALAALDSIAMAARLALASSAPARGRRSRSLAQLRPPPPSPPACGLALTLESPPSSTPNARSGNLYLGLFASTPIVRIHPIFSPE